MFEECFNWPAFLVVVVVVLVPSGTRLCLVRTWIFQLVSHGHSDGN